jgi:16S rRNA (cytosine1402-N4)-methyltransferase
MTESGKDPAALHVPVLLKEVLSTCAPGRVAAIWTDPGPGRAHQGILEAAGPGAEVLGLDRDAQALELARERLAPYGDAVQFALCRFSRLDNPWPNWAGTAWTGP